MIFHIRIKVGIQSITLPMLSTGFGLSSAYLYLIIAGENVPFWVYIMVFGLLAYGIYTTYKKIKDNKQI